MIITTNHKLNIGQIIEGKDYGFFRNKNVWHKDYRFLVLKEVTKEDYDNECIAQDTKDPNPNKYFYLISMD